MEITPLAVYNNRRGGFGIYIMNYSRMDRLETKYSYAMESCSTPQTGWQDDRMMKN